MSSEQSSSSSSAQPSSEPQQHDVIGLCKINDSFYTEIKHGDGTSSIGKLVADVIGTDFPVVQHNILLPNQEVVRLKTKVGFQCASIRSIELILPKSNLSDIISSLELIWSIGITVGDTKLLQMGAGDLKLMYQIQPSLASEYGEDICMTITTLQELPLFMLDYNDILIHAVYNKHMMTLGARIKYSYDAKGNGRELIHKYIGSILSTPFLTSLTKYWQNGSRLTTTEVITMSGVKHQVANIPVYPRTTSIFIFNHDRALELDYVRAIYCGTKMHIKCHTSRIYSITFDPEQAEAPFTPRRNYERVASASEGAPHQLTIRSPRRLTARLRYMQANMFTSLGGMTRMHHAVGK
jgi:hypothetical protein